ncbi:hypothetical protein [Saccharopolyspora mangrovi]|uniref:Uncharacterized protein n=1 Tax=Saccharopolyspora mangrovi TaxID=3082379 RepID=A0ABU6A6R6_9PSEU|nr:hypothetical protein [Saccharopolyspora sp. S2-29]MEB3367253.1 hypothetical protein [Saccharopolyspora sp. S2-29]
MSTSKPAGSRPAADLRIDSRISFGNSLQAQYMLEPSRMFFQRTSA